MATINGTPGRDVLNGDTISSDLNDFISGGSGNDTIRGLEGSDFLGHVIIRNGFFTVRQMIEPGNDVLLGGNATDSIGGGDGNDIIEGGGDDDFLGNIRILLDSTEIRTFDPGSDRISGNAGNDSLSGGPGNDQLFGGEGSDFMGQYSLRLRVTGAASANLNTSGTDAGNDRLDGENGDDTIGGGTGNDRIFGNSGDDTIGHSSFQLNTTFSTPEFSGSIFLQINTTDPGNDRISGGSGDDRVSGGPGNDTLLGGTGNDYLGEYAVTDNVDLEAINDLAGISVSEFATTPFRGSDPGNDVLNGGAGNDIMTGGRGNDTLLGKGGADQLVGVSLRSLRRAGRREVDSLRGGNGADTFVLGQGRAVFYNDRNSRSAGLGDYAIIEDFRKRSDRIQLVGRAENYQLGASPIRGERGTAIFLDRGERTPELIAIVQGSSFRNFNRGFTFV
ncbi:MAG: calcium-binding protein [Cyanobacteria bacterium J06633_2]